MYSSLPHLQTAIRSSLQKGALCRIYPESLDACWAHIAPESRAQKVAQFAAQNHWDVNFRTLGAMGMVAEFVKAG
ncbi:MAG TPA: hypothetical protein VK961_24730 [Chthoniobacter sp.]|nr:hypothetical protein [Chthoniobacter sp.]